MAGEEGFLALAKEGHGEGPLRVAQAEAKELHPGLAAVQVDMGLAPVNLRLAGSWSRGIITSGRGRCSRTYWRTV